MKREREWKSHVEKLKTHLPPVGVLTTCQLPLFSTCDGVCL